MATFSAALDLLVARLEGATPETDPQALYSLSRTGQASHIDRQFSLVPPVELATTSNQIDPAQMTVGLEVYYRGIGDRYAMLQRAADDLEQLVQRLSYTITSGGCWAAGYDFEALDPRISADNEGGLVAKLTIRITYNITT
jgi:hypothetical protein